MTNTGDKGSFLGEAKHMERRRDRQRKSMRSVGGERGVGGVEGTVLGAGAADGTRLGKVRLMHV